MENTDGSPGMGSANDATRQIKETVSNLTGSAKEAMSRGAEAGVQRASDSAKDLAATLRSAASAIPDEGSWVASLLNRSAEGVDRATSSLSDGDLSGVLQEVNGFARRQPALFLGACVALGFAAARVGKTAIEQSASSANDGAGSI